MSHYLFSCQKSLLRKEPCPLCQTTLGNLVGQVNYFDVALYDMVQCPECGLIGPDPIPTVDDVKEGCNRLYQSGYGGEDPSKVLRGFMKSFRKGAAFARTNLAEGKNRNQAIQILEVGAGDGYFSAGIQAEIPNAKITLLDVVPDVVRYYRAYHTGVAVLGEFETEIKAEPRFDLIIFRDLLEHVRNPVLFLNHAKAALKLNGLVYFITPNGKEDFWLIHQRFQKTGKPTLLLLNHFYYFLPETLERMLKESGFKIEKGFKFGLKGHRAGLGHQNLSGFPEETVPEWRPKANSKPSILTRWAHDSKKLKNHLLARPGIISRWYHELIDKERELKPFHHPIGHEFSITARKNQNP